MDSEKDTHAFKTDTPVKNRHTHLLLLGIEKAFNSVWHNGLIYKLRQIEIPGQITNLIKNYLTDRQIYVSINGICSSTKKIKTGVPQGSILGPILYSTYTNNIPIANQTQLAIC